MARILVIDDDRIQRVVATRALSKCGHEVIEAPDGLDGLEAARTQHPDLIVCDVLMPGLDGLQFVAALRQEEGIADIPVIMLTSRSERADMRAGMNSGADDYLSKPFSFDELNEAVAALLAKRRVVEENLINAMNSSLQAALDEQKESLASRYEQRYVQELSARWDRSDANTEVRYEQAVVLKVDFFAPLMARLAGDGQLAATVRRAWQGARDALHLFSAEHLLPSGNEMLAVFVDERGSPRAGASARAMRAVIALRKAVATVLPQDAAPPAAGTAPPVTVAVHRGPVTVLRVSDPLHGEPDSTLAAGATMVELAALIDFARSSQWGIAVSRGFAGSLPGQLVTAREAHVLPIGQAAALDAVEVVALQ